jgi:hypothetical protein
MTELFGSGGSYPNVIINLPVYSCPLIGVDQIFLVFWNLLIVGRGKVEYCNYQQFLLPHFLKFWMLLSIKQN